MNPSPSVERRFRLAGALELGLDGAAGLFLPILTLAPHGAAALAAVAGVLALILLWARGGAAWPKTLTAMFAALIVCGVASAWWAVNPHRTLLMAARLTGLFAVGLALIAVAPRLAAPERLVRWLLAGLAAALVLALVQFLTRGLLSRPLAGRVFTDPALNQVENGLVLLVLPLCALLLIRRGRIAAGAFALATLAVICVLRGDAGHTALAVGVIGAALFYWWRGRLAHLAAAAAVVVALVAPLAFPPLAGIVAAQHDAPLLKHSAWHRLEIWSFVGGRIAERPLLGWGLDSSRAIPGGTELTPEGRAWLPLHPHNVPLQLWLELGVPGAALLALFAAWIWLAIGRVRWPRPYAAAAAGSLAAGFTIALGAYGAWEEWWIASEFIAAFLIIATARLLPESA
jgi:O-antigen ligase